MKSNPNESVSIHIPARVLKLMHSSRENEVISGRNAVCRRVDIAFAEKYKRPRHMIMLTTDDFTLEPILQASQDAGTQNGDDACRCDESTRCPKHDA